MIKLNPGDVYNKLTAINYVGKHSIWLWKCECGNTKIISKYDVTHGRIRSCGCLVKERAHLLNLKPNGEAAINSIYLVYKNGAKYRNLTFELSKDKFKELINCSCHYCGMPPSNEYKSRYSSGNYKYNGLDRINSHLGYTEDNVVTSCYFCNRLKGALSYGDFLDWIERIKANPKYFVDCHQDISRFAKNNDLVAFCEIK